MWWIVLISVVLVLIIFFLLPLFVTICFKANVFNNEVEINVKLFGITLIKQKKCLFEFVKKKKKSKKISPLLLLKLLSKIKIINFDLNFFVGNKGEAMATALMCGGLKTLCQNITIVLNNYVGCNTKYAVSADFMETKFECYLKVLFFFIPLSLIFAYLKIKLKGR